MRILYVEDDPGCRFVMGKFLRDHELRVVETGEEGVVAVLECAPDLVFVDVNLPGEIDGYETARLIKSADGDLPVVAVTANVMAGERNRALSAGCDDFLGKPLRKEEVWALVDRWERTGRG